MAANALLPLSRSRTLARTLSRAQMIDIVARHMALGGDPDGRAEVARLPDETLRTIAEAVMGTVHPGMRGALTEAPEAEFPQPPEPPPALAPGPLTPKSPWMGPENFGPRELHAGETPEAIMAQARGSAGGTGGRFGAPFSMQGAPSSSEPFPVETREDFGRGAQRPGPSSPPARPPGNLGPAFQGVITPEMQVMPGPRSGTGAGGLEPTAQPATSPGESDPTISNMNQIEGSLLAGIQRVADSGSRAGLPLLVAQLSFARAQANLLPGGIDYLPGQSPRDQMHAQLNAFSKDIDDLRQSLPAERAGADNSVAWAQLAYTKNRDLVRDARADQEFAAQYRGWYEDPATGEIVKSRSLLEREEDIGQRNLQNEIGMAGVTGMFQGEPTYARLRNEEQDRQKEADRRAQLARDFTGALASSIKDLYVARRAAEDDTRAAAQYRVSRTHEYVPGREPDNPWAAVYAKAGIPWQPQRTADLPEWRNPMDAFEEYRRQVEEAIRQHPGNQNPLMGFYE